MTGQQNQWIEKKYSATRHDKIYWLDNYIDFISWNGILFTYLFWEKMLKCDFFVFHVWFDFFSGGKGNQGMFSKPRPKAEAEKAAEVAFSPRKKSNHTRKTKKVTLSHFFPEQISKQNAFSYCLEVSYNHKVNKISKCSV